MKKLFLFSWLMMLSIVAMAQNEKVGNDLVIKNGAGTVVERVSVTESTEMKFDAQGNKLSIKQGGETKDISLDQVKTISAVPAFKLVAQGKYVYTSTAPITLHFKLTTNDKGEMKPVSGESVSFKANEGTLAPITATTNDNGVATVEYTPAQSLWAPGFSDEIKAIYTYTDNSGSVSRYTANAYVGYSGDYTIECLTPDQKLGPGEEAEAVFAVYEVSPSGKKPYAGASIEFSAPEGYITTQSNVTDANGMVRVKFLNDGDDAKEYPVRARYGIWMNGAFYTGTATAKFIALNYKLEAVYPKLAIRNDGSEQFCLFKLYEYHNGEWQLSQKEAEAKFEATNVTLTNTSDIMNLGYVSANFTVGKSFNQGSVTAKCDIPLESGKVWQGVVTTEFVLDDYLFFRAIPVDDPADIYPEESQDVAFTLVKIVNGQPQPCSGMEVSFRCLSGGTLTSTLVKTDAEGLATTSFQLNKDKDYATVYANCSFADEQGIWHSYAESLDFELMPFKLAAVHPKQAVRDDGSEQECYFMLYEYNNGQWEEYEGEGEIDFEATGVTLKNTSYMYSGSGALATFTAGQVFIGGSITATCSVELEEGRTREIEATTELLPDDYQFSRVLPAEQLSDIYPEQSQDVVFSLTKLVDGWYQPFQGMKVEFGCESGSLTNTVAETDAEGKAATSFRIDKDKKYAFVFAFCSFIDEHDIWHDYRLSDVFNLIPYKLKCLTPEVEMSRGEGDGSTTIRYELLEYKNGEWVACPDKKLLFTATNGTADPDYAITNKDGICQTEFLPSDDATEGTVTGTCTIVINENYERTWSESQTAHITIVEGGGSDIDDEELQKAEKLKENTYEIKNKTTGLTEIREYNTKYSEWTKETDVISFQLSDEAEDEQGNPDTNGVVWGFIPKGMVNMVLFLNGQQFENTPGAKFGFDALKGKVSADFAKFSGDEPFGNIKWSVSRIMLRPKVKVNHARSVRGNGEEEYTGEYELLYYIAFQNRTWNQETGQEELGDEYEVYGRGTMKMHVPTVTSFVARTEKDWVKVGESTKVTLEQYYEEGATWDWNDVQIVGQSTDYSKARNGEDDGFFSWDASTQTLTSLKSNDNKYVWVYLGLKSKSGVKAPVQVATGEGWKYTMIKTSKEEISCKANSYPDFSFDWTPKASDSEKMDFNALELDPDCVPAGYFQFPTSYASQGWPVHVSSNCAPGEYTLRFRVKSNHDVNCTMKFVVTPAED